MTRAGFVEEMLWDQAIVWFRDRGALRAGFEGSRQEARDPQLDADLASHREEFTKQDRLATAAGTKCGR